MVGDVARQLTKDLGVGRQRQEKTCEREQPFRAVLNAPAVEAPAAILIINGAPVPELGFERPPVPDSLAYRFEVGMPASRSRGGATLQRQGRARDFRPDLD